MTEQIVSFRTKTIATVFGGREFDNIVDLATYLAEADWEKGTDVWLNSFNRYFEMYKDEFR